MISETGYWYPAGRGRRYDVKVDVGDDSKLRIAGNAQLAMTVTGRSVDQTVNISELKISDRLAHTPRFIRLPDGSMLEFTSNEFIDRYVVEHRALSPETLLHRFESRWVYALVALVLVVLGITGFFRFVLPPIASQVVRVIPVDVEQNIGFDVMEQLDVSYLKKSSLPFAREQEIRAMFEVATENIDTEYEYRLYFRSGVGPNAFALPGGHVILTEEFIELAESDEEILAVLAHEIGHVEHQHVLKGMIKDAASVVLLVTIFGDVSAVSVLALSAPTFLSSMQFSRSHETQADHYAVEYLNSNDGDPMALATMLSKLMGESADDSLSNYFSTHPGLERRIENIKSFSNQP